MPSALRRAADRLDGAAVEGVQGDADADDRSRPPEAVEREGATEERTVLEEEAAAAENERQAERRAVSVGEARIPPARPQIDRLRNGTSIAIRRVDLVRVELTAVGDTDDGNVHAGG